MGASVSWLPVVTDRQSLVVGSGGQFVSAMEAAFGPPGAVPPRWTLGGGDVPVLVGMRAVARASGWAPNADPFSKLIEALHEHERIEVFVEY